MPADFADPIHVVLGNAFGDEGKGLVTDWLSDRGTLVIRFCGGAQAGHTVTTPEGTRHVFHTVGSGTFRGAPTYLSRFVAFDPVALMEELDTLEALRWAPGNSPEGLPRFPTPRVYADPLAPVVTVYDILRNQLLERSRGERAHGSCGAGVGECFRRMEETPLRLYARDLWGPRPWLQARLQSIRAAFDVFVEQIQTTWTGLHGAAWQPPSLQAIHVVQAELVERWSAAVSALYTRGEVTLMDLGTVAWGRRLVFEGAQGLLLDRDFGAFPHVTRAKTGLANVQTILGELGRGSTPEDRVSAWFVSRCYLTRHGNGPLPHELPEAPVPSIDATNVENPWQGKLRYAPWDGQLLASVRQMALAEAPGLHVASGSVVTCLDQVDGSIPIVGADSGVLSTSAETFTRGTAATAWGPTRATMRLPKPT